MTIYYLYLKTHSVTGLKYLGFTKKQNPHEYSGSGTDWLDHLKENGYSFTTKILLCTEDPDEIRETGLFFSKIWNVVESKEFANRIPEGGSNPGKWNMATNRKSRGSFQIQNNVPARYQTKDSIIRSKIIQTVLSGVPMSFIEKISFLP